MMKKTRSDNTAAEPAKPAKKLPVEALNLSPERIMQGASTTTKVLVGILAQQEESHQWRHWGINE